MTHEEHTTFRAIYGTFKWFSHTRKVHLYQLALARMGTDPLLATEWSSRMQRCGYCKRRMKQLISQMEAIVRPYSPYLQEHRPC